MKILAQNGGETMSEKIYNASVKSKRREFDRKTRRQGPREITLSVIGIGAASIPEKVGKGIPLSIGDKLKVKLSKKSNDTWIVTQIISVNGKKTSFPERRTTTFTEAHTEIE